MSLRTVPPFVTAHMLCASRDIRNLTTYTTFFRGL